MEPRLQRATKALVIERMAVGGLVALAPGRVIRTIAPPESETEAARYMARLLGIRQVVLGVMLWQSRHDRAAAPDGNAQRRDGGARCRGHARARCSSVAVALPRRSSARRSQRRRCSSPSARRRPELGGRRAGGRSIGNRVADGVAAHRLLLARPVGPLKSQRASASWGT